MPRTGPGTTRPRLQSDRMILRGGGSNYSKRRPSTSRGNRGKLPLKQHTVLFRPIILLIFWKPWHYQQTVLHHIEPLPFPAIPGHWWGSETSQAISPGGPAPASISELLIPPQPSRPFGEGFFRPAGDQQNHRQPRERADSSPSHRPTLAKHIPPLASF